MAHYFKVTIGHEKITIVKRIPKASGGATLVGFVVMFSYLCFVVAICDEVHNVETKLHVH